MEDDHDPPPPPGERSILTKRLLGVAFSRKGKVVAALLTVLLAGATEAAPIFLANVFVDDILLSSRGKEARIADTPAGRSIAWREADGTPKGVRIDPATDAVRPLPAAEAETAAPGTTDSNFSRMAVSAVRRISGTETARTSSLLIFLVVAILLTSLLAAVATYGHHFLSRSLATNVVAELRILMLERLLKAPVPYFARRKLGDLQSRLTNDVTLTQHTVELFVSDMLLQPAIILFGVGSMLYVNWRLSLAAFIFLPMVVVPVLQLGRTVQKRAKRALESLGDATESANQALSGVRTIKAFAAEERETADFRLKNEDWRTRTLRIVRARAFGRGVMDVSYGIVLSITLGMGGWLVIDGRWNVRPGDFFAFVVALGVILQPLKRVVGAFHTWSEVLAGARRIFEVIDTPSERPDAASAKQLGPVRQGVRFEHVSFSYPDAPDQPVLQDVSFEIPAGKSAALVGASGAGKSTIADLLLRFHDPVGGRILIDGTPLADAARKSLLAQIAVVSQQPFVFNRSLEENIRYGRPDASPEDVRAAAQAALVEEFLPALPDGYRTVLGDRGASLSGGQLQRITIARALLKNASVLILDEATSNLDARSEALVQEALFNLVQGRTALIIAHRLSTIERADEILVLDGGRIVERGSHDQLLALGGAYARLRSALGS